jgi:hypothetical protein
MVVSTHEMINLGDIVFKRKRRPGTVRKNSLYDKTQIGLVIELLEETGCVPQCRVQLGTKRLWFYSHDLQKAYIDEK